MVMKYFYMEAISNMTPGHISREESLYIYIPQLRNAGDAVCLLVLRGVVCALLPAVAR